MARSLAPKYESQRLRLSALEQDSPLIYATQPDSWPLFEAAEKWLREKARPDLQQHSSAPTNQAVKS